MDSKILKEQLKKEIDIFVKNGGNILQSVDKLPYGVLIYQIIFLEKKEGKKTSIIKLHHDCGYDEYNLVYQEVNLERIKMEIEAHIKNGGSILDKVETLYYYPDIQIYISRQARKGKRITTEDVYNLCGYEDASKDFNEIDVAYFFNANKDENGSISCLKKSEKGILMIKSVYRKSVRLGVDFHKYLMSMYGVRFDSTRSMMNTIEYVEKALKIYYRKYGRTNMTIKDIARNDPILANKIKYLESDFLLGKASFLQILNCFGYNLQSIVRVNEKEFLKELNEKYPDKQVDEIFNDNRHRMALIRVAAQNNKSVFAYLKDNGFTWKERYSRIKLENNDHRYKAICEYRRKLLEKSIILNSDEYLKSEKNKEFIRIGKLVLSKVEEIDNKRKKLN